MLLKGSPAHKLPLLYSPQMPKIKTFYWLFGITMPLPTTHQSSTLYQPFNQEDEAHFYQAFMKGTVKGLEDLVQLVVHPIDNVLSPLYEIASDIALISAKNPPTDDPFSHGFLTRINDQHPSLINEATTRMDLRIEHLRSLGVQFMNATPDQRTELSAEFLTTILTPGLLFKGIKGAAVTIRNLDRFGVPLEPPLFRNPKLALTTPQQFEIFTAKEVAGMSSSNELLYVITESRELLFCVPHLETSIPKVVYTPKFQIVDTNKISHTQLASYKNVYAAGEVSVFEGKIAHINPNAEGYLCTGPLLGRVIQHIFEKNGITDPLNRLNGYRWTTPPGTAASTYPMTMDSLIPKYETLTTMAIELGTHRPQTNTERLVAEAYSDAFKQSLPLSTLRSRAEDITAISTPRHDQVRALPQVPPITTTKFQFDQLAKTLLDSRKHETQCKMDTIFAGTALSSTAPSPNFMSNFPSQWQAPKVGQRFFSNTLTRSDNHPASSPTSLASPFNPSFFSREQERADKIATRFQQSTTNYLQAAKK